MGLGVGRWNDSTCSDVDGCLNCSVLNNDVQVGPHNVYALKGPTHVPAVLLACTILCLQIVLTHHQDPFVGAKIRLLGQISVE